MFRSQSVCLLLFLVMVVTGCRQPVTNPSNRQGLFGQNPFGGQQQRYAQAAANDIPNLDIQMGVPEGGLSNTLPNEMANLSQQLGTFDADNQNLHSELAGLQQQLQLANDYNRQLRQQLADTSSQYQQMQSVADQARQQLTANEAQVREWQQAAQAASDSRSAVPSQLAGVATVRANNSLTQKFQNISLPTGEVRMDGDVIRVEIPSESLFMPGSYQIQASQMATLRTLADTIRREFPQQIVGIEAHWDGAPLNQPGTTAHQLTGTQALAVFNEMQKLGLPERQMFVMALGSNRSRHPANAPGSPNRRVELVIYPEKY